LLYELPPPPTGWILVMTFLKNGSTPHTTLDQQHRAFGFSNFRILFWRIFRLTFLNFVLTNFYFTKFEFLFYFFFNFYFTNFYFTFWIFILPNFYFTRIFGWPNFRLTQILFYPNFILRIIFEFGLTRILFDGIFLNSCLPNFYLTADLWIFIWLTRIEFFTWQANNPYGRWAFLWLTKFVLTEFGIDIDGLNLDWRSQFSLTPMGYALRPVRVNPYNAMRHAG